MDEPINFKDILRTIEAGFGKNLRTTEARFDFTGPYKKKECIDGVSSPRRIVWVPLLWSRPTAPPGFRISITNISPGSNLPPNINKYFPHFSNVQTCQKIAGNGVRFTWHTNDY